MHQNENDDTTKVDVIRGDPKVALKTIAWPMIFTLVLNMIYNMVDRVWVAGLGADPLAAIGFVAPIFIIIGGIGNGFGAGANSLISRYIGAKDKQNASNSAIHSILIALALSIIIPIILMPLLKQLLLLMGAESVLKLATDYATIIIIGGFTLIFNGVLSSQLRAEGDVNRATKALVITGILNIIIDPIFIYVLNLGVAGAAIATVLSALVATVLMLYWILVKKDTYVDVGRDQFKFSPKIIKEIIAVAVPGSVEQVIISLISIVMNAVLAMVASTDVIAAFTAAFSIIQVGMMFPVGIATAAITVAGVAYGARDFKRVEFVCKYAIKLSMSIVILIVALMAIFAPQIAMLFSYSAATASLNALVTEALRVLLVFLIGVPVGLCCAFTFQGIGKGTISLILTILREAVFVLVFLYLFVFVLGMGQIGAYLSMGMAGVLGSVVAAILFKYYMNKLQKFEGKAPDEC